MTTKRWLILDEKSLIAVLRDAAQNLQGNECELGLDFILVRRLDSSALQAIEEFAGAAEEKGIKVVLRAIDPYVYRVLKLMKLTSRFSFADSGSDREGAELECSHAQSAAK
jgi:anti-anti-sigma regulatory factor